MDGSAQSMQARRRATPWILWSAGGACALGVMALVLWTWLPTWAPEWVVRHSPFVEPVFRAVGGTLLTGQASGPMADDFVTRVEAWGPGMAPHLAAGLVADDVRVRRSAMVACNILIGAGRLRGDADLAAALARVLPDANPHMRGSAARCLGSIRDPSAVLPLIAQLSVEPDAEEARWMCESLGRFGDERALGVLDRILAGVPVDPGQVALVVQALCSVAELDREHALPRLISALAHAHPHVRVTAAVLLGRLEEPRALEPLLARLADPHVTVVQQAILALVAIRDERVVGPVLTALEATWTEVIPAESAFDLEYRVDYQDHVEVIDRLPFSPDQRKRWEDLRKR